MNTKKRVTRPTTRRATMCDTRSKQRTDVLSAEVGEDLEGTTSEVGGSSIVVGEATECAFFEPISLDGIPLELQEKMFALAPILRGREAKYTAEFFEHVMGLQGHGVPLDKVMVDSPLTDDEIFELWKPAMRSKNRFPLANCLNAEQRQQFALHYVRVYGCRPDNNCFSLKFLRGCFATFVYHIDVDWISEAVKRRNLRVERAANNPQKLGPLALREQLKSLCDLIADENAASGTQARSNSNSRSPDEQALIAEIKDYVVAKRQAESKLESWRKHLEECEGTLKLLCQEEDSLKQQWTCAEKEAVHSRSEGRLDEAKEKKIECRSLIRQLQEKSERVSSLEVKIDGLQNETMPKKLEKVEAVKKALAGARERLKALRRANLVLRPTSSFHYPEGRSFPRMSQSVVKDLCAICTNGFVARLAITSSCGCAFHPSCTAELLQSGQFSCPRCNARLDGSWVHQFSYALEPSMNQDVEAMKAKLEVHASGLKDGSIEEHVVNPKQIILSLTPAKRTSNTTPGGSRTGVHVAITSTSPSTMNFSVRPRKDEGESSIQPSKSLSELGYQPRIPPGVAVKNLFSGGTSTTLEAGQNCEMDLTFDSAFEIVIQQACITNKEPGTTP